MFNLYFLQKYAQMRHKELLEEAALERLLQECEGERSKLWQKLSWQVGDLMIEFGHKLQEGQVWPQRYEDKASSR
jgi:hypothetical protein